MSTIGQMLKEAREKRGLDIEEVYLKTKISQKILEALEQEKADNMIGFIYVKNFVKQYANFLGLDGETLSKQYANSHKQKTDTAPLRVTLERPKGQKIRMPYNAVLVLILIIFAIVAIFGIISIIRKSQLTKLTQITKPASNITKDSTPFVVPKNKKLALTVAATNKVWVQIKSDGDVIFQSILAKNSTETWRANENFELWIGKPDAVKLELNGKPLILPKDKKIKGLKITHQGLKF